jgi:pSer/pThr/pTyr-binding forkhead associated (FHA) protein
MPQQRRRSSRSKLEKERRDGIEIKQPSFLIGREDDNTLIVNDDQASAYHAKITSDGQQFRIEDLGSTNGTYIDGIRIYTLSQLRPGCLIKIGSTILKFGYIPTDEA